ncbi:MAG: alpha-glucosidase/alpha-galactosidase [Lentisphaeria bacterium]|nr:MAG: alpha-glucosidase/alpha-galactosidase [Lentisphaeria bacterium]
MDKIIHEMGVPACCEATTDRREALKGTDFVIITVMVGRFEKYKADIDIPAKYGVFQAVSDTTGPGSLMRIVRTAPVLIGIAEELRELAPDAWVLNYANPMAMNTWTLLRAGHKKSVGLCHSIQGCRAGRFEKWFGIPASEIDATAGGINHMDYYLTLTHNGEDLYPALREAEERIVKENPGEKLRFELLRRLGYFPAEGPMHQAEYHAWFMKDMKTGESFGAQFGYGYQNDFKNANDKQEMALNILSGKEKLTIKKSNEYASGIIHSLKTGVPLEIYGNVLNTGLITNLPPECVVEVPCLIGKDSIKPCYVGKLPPQLAAVMTPHVFLYEMGVEAVFRRDRGLLLKALQADPLTERF